VRVIRKIFGCGDIFVAKRLPAKRYEGFSELAEIIKSHDACFGNLETTIHNNEGYPAKFPGGGYAMASPYCLEDLKNYGFNIFNIANNHTLDYSHKGLEATIKYLNASDIPFCGAGMTLAEASQPKYVECAEGRVAFIGVTSSFHDSDAAGPTGGIISGRPGVNPLRRIEYYNVTPEHYAALKEIAESTGMNDGHKWSIANGYREESRELFLREMRFVQSDCDGRVTHPLKEDMDRVKLSILEASKQADCIVISFHSHQMDGINTRPAEFIREFCHECIDAGANVIFGHGAHELRGLEIYKNCPIFYGLGDFIFHNEMQSAMPREFYEKVGLDYSEHDFVGIAMDTRSKGRTRGLQADPKAWETVAASIEFLDGNVNKINIYPVTLGYELGRSCRGWPMIDRSGKILNYFTNLSEKDYGTKVVVNNNIGQIMI